MTVSANSIRKVKINALVAALLATHGITQAPVAVAQIAEAQGAAIVHDTVDTDLSGFLYRGGATPVIGINSRHSAVRQNFTIAHHLGYLLLHQHPVIHIVREFRTPLRDTATDPATESPEREANYFAQALLMPEAFLAADLKEMAFLDAIEDERLENLAGKYGVSRHMLLCRLHSVGLLEEA